MRHSLAAPRPAIRHRVAELELRDLAEFDVLLLGCSTWYVGELQSDWEARIDELERIDLRGRRVALFGMGDQLGYPETFQNAMGILSERLEATGVEPLGAWPAEGYRHVASRAQRGDRFVGLALDEMNEPDRTGSRIRRWVDQLIEEMAVLRTSPPHASREAERSDRGS